VSESERSELDPVRVIETRYEIQRTLGQGAAGIVYEVRDRETGERLALKKLLRMDMKSVRRLKQEFRSLTRLHHPNLVKLYDLGRTDDAWFITMEHLQGVDLIRHVRGETDVHGTMRRLRPTNHNAALADLESLCSVFLQLARGIRALHRAGMLHRDLKPSNVLVAQDRVVILDFGLVRELGEYADTVTQEEAVAGTPAYMAPEQVQNSALGEAADWYAFGVMLYEALSGELPIDGSLYDLLHRKLESDPRPIDQVVSGIPRTLAALCTALLRREPTARPSYDGISEVLTPLAPNTESSPISELAAEQLAPAYQQARPVLVGRSGELLQLERALQEVVHGRLSAVHVRGAAGVGKSALLEQFFAEREPEGSIRPSASPGLLVLRARCYEREAMPFKALDGLLDALVAYLTRLDELVVSHVLPVRLPELARAFPVLERLPAVRSLLAQSPPPLGDAARERTRAKLALQELLSRVAAHRPLVLWIDDLQWGDLDSVHILRSWLELPESLPILFVFSYRSDEQETNACLKLLTQRERARPVPEVVIELAPLSASDVEALCVQTLGDRASAHASLIAHIVLDVQGSPFLARQLLTLAVARIAQGEQDLCWLSIDNLLSQVTALLSPVQRALLNVLAIAGRPVTAQLLLHAAKVRRGGRSELHALHVLNLTRVRIVNGQRMLEVYHHRLREAVVAGLSDAERVDTHRRLLSVLELLGTVDTDWLHVVALGAKQDDAAVRYGLAAAERAVASLAFERAAELYQDCLTRSPEAAESGQLWRRLGDALAACGRGERAAKAYVESVRRGPPGAVLELNLLAAMHFILSGHFDEGEALVRTVLEGTGQKVPETESGLIAAIVWERLQLAVRGLAYKPRSIAEAPSEAQHLAFMYGALSIDTQAYDPLRAALFSARALRLALELGVPELVVITMCVAANMRSVSGSERDAKQAEAMLDRAEAISLGLKEPLVRTRVLGTRAMFAFLQARTARCVELCVEVERLYSVHIHSVGQLPGEYYWRFVVRAAHVGALFQLGKMSAASVALHELLSDPHVLENRTALLHLAMVRSLDDILHGRASQARVRLDSERPSLPQRGFGPLHLLHVVAVMRVGCVLGDYAWTQAVLAELWPRFQRSIVRRSVIALLAYGAHARVVLNQHVLERRSGDPKALLQDDLRALQSLGVRLRAPSTPRFEARLAYIAGQRERAAALYRQHVTGCEQNDAADDMQRARWALGRVLQGDEGARLCEAASSSLRELGVVDPRADFLSHFPELA